MRLHARFSFGACLALVVGAVACGSDSTEPSGNGDVVSLSATQLGSLDSVGTVIVGANPGIFDLESLADSTFDVLTAGIQARRAAVTTDLAASSLLFVGIHRVFTHASGTHNFATWTVVGIDDPAKLTTLVEVNGFAASGSGRAPESVSGTIGDGSGIANGLFIQVGAAAAVTEWIARGGTASFSSDSTASGAACPGFTSTPILTCTVETMHVHFAATAPSGTGSAVPRQASLPDDLDVPTMRLNYRTP